MNYRDFLDEVLTLNPTNGRRAINEIQQIARNELDFLANTVKPATRVGVTKVVKEKTD